MIVDTSIYIGKKFGRLLIISFTGIKKHGHYIVFCQCDCGKSHECSLTSIKKGFTKSCGCLISETQRNRNTTHGLSTHRLYGVWSDMKQRCLNPATDNYKDYGGRGITIFPPWIDDAKNFIEWALNNGYKKGLQLDRRENSGHYTPENCRFVTNKVNSRNTRKVVVYTYKGVSKTLGEWSESLNVTKELIRGRLRRGWSFEEAIEYLIVPQYQPA